MKERREWTEAQVRTLAEDQDFLCAYCLVRLGSVVSRPGKSDVVTTAQVDHIVPVSWSGAPMEHLANLVVACQVCNAMKGDLVFESISDAMRHLNRAWAAKGYSVPWSPEVSNLSDAARWAGEYKRYLRIVGIGHDSD